MTGAIVQEWFAPRGGSENVAAEMARTFPSARVMCLWGEEPFGGVSPDRRWESWIAATPLRRHKAAALPFMIPTWRHLPGSYQWLLISSHLFAHHARLGFARDVPKLVYAHTPARYIWNPSLDERGDSLVVRAASKMLRPLDRIRAQEATSIAANSSFVRERIAAAWRRDARVIYPPVATEQICAVGEWADHVHGAEQRVIDELPGEFVLGVSRFVPYKRLDLVIAAAQEIGLPAVIVGAGPQEQELRTLAAEVSVPVTFVISPSDALLYAIYQKALALVFPPVEDFGIVPIEAMALGTPVIVNQFGGAKESLEAVGGIGGEIWDLEIRSFGAAFAAATENAPRVDVVAARFSCARFRSELREWLSSEIGESAL